MTHQFKAHEMCFHSGFDEDCLACWSGRSSRQLEYTHHLHQRLERVDLNWIIAHDQKAFGGNAPHNIKKNQAGEWGIIPVIKEEP